MAQKQHSGNSSSEIDSKKDIAQGAIWVFKQFVGITGTDSARIIQRCYF